MHFLEDSQTHMILMTEKMMLGLMRQMVGLKVYRNRKSKTIHMQGACTFWYELSKSYTHLTNKNLIKTEDLPTLCNNKPYAELVSSLMYAAVGSRPDLAHTVSALSQFTI